MNSYIAANTRYTNALERAKQAQKDSEYYAKIARELYEKVEVAHLMLKQASQ